MRLASAHSLDATEADDVEAVLNLLHGREPNATSCRHDGIALCKLADHIGTLMEHQNAVPELVRDELVEFVRSLGIELSDVSCPHACYSDASSDPISEATEILQAKLQGAADAEIFEGAAQHEVGEGTSHAPLEMPRRSKLPLSEFKSKGYMTLAFPTLFPNGRGHFDEMRDRPLKWEDWSQQLMHFYDGRFATHRRFPHFLLNTHERFEAINKAGIFVARDPQAGRLTLGQLRNLGKQERETIFRRLSSYGATLRNTPAFFKQRRHELRAMIEQLGDPHVFATNSHADTHCPYLHRFIIAGAQIAAGSERDPFAEGLASGERYKRRLANVVAYPHLTAQFFHLKTELFFEHIGEALGCEAHWCRYEWQSRGSTHAHYFLWLKDTPDVSFLNEWVQEELHALGDGEKLTPDVVEAIVKRLNERALAASEWTPPGGWHDPRWRSADALVGAIADGQVDGLGEQIDAEAVRAAYAAQWWASRCGRWNRGWEPDEKRPFEVGNSHPSSEEHRRCSPAELLDAERVHDSSLDALPVEIAKQRERLLNKNNRHTVHYPSYCLRRDQHGKEFCRFGFPHEPREPNAPHFYFELVRNKDGSPKGVRAQFYLPMNDPLMNTTNAEQAASQRANVDFKPLIDHFSALEYATKYATKQEKGSKAFEKLMALALNGGGRAEPEVQGRSAKGAFASFLVQQIGGRDWSAQEVAHVTMGFPTVIASHKFAEYGVTNQARLKEQLDEDGVDDAVADQQNRLDQYFDRLGAVNMLGGQQTLHDVGVVGGNAAPAVDREEIAACSFAEFWRQYHFVSGGRGRGHQIAPRTEPTIISIKPHVPSSWNKAGHEKRPEYCRIMLLKYHPFVDRDDYQTYIFKEHRGDFEAAYEDFALTDPRAPNVCKDDFRSMIFFDEGDEIEAEQGADEHPDFAAYRVNPAFEQATEKIKEQQYDWASHSAKRYSSQEISDAGTWQQRAAQEERTFQPSTRVDVGELNDGQRTVYDAVMDHAHRRVREVVQPLHAMVCGTAGSGKTFLIRAIKQELGNACLVLAPTGVAADNIGGRTYQSVVPMPRKDIDREDIIPKDKKRIERVVAELDGVSYIVIDEMSMVGRRSLGQVDALLQHATGCKQLFGGLSVILVGDHGQLPPVKDRRCFDWAGVRHTTQKLFKRVLTTAPKWQRLGVDAYEAFTTVFFLDRIERIAQSDDAGEAQLLERFRSLQLRARDGELTETDYAFMKEHMSLEGRETQFAGPDTYRLVTTQAARDEKNNAEFEAALERNIPSLTIPAINSGPAAMAADDEEMGNLVNELHLSLGARVMITRNLCVVHGLCNGTIGIVHDILVNDKGIAAAVLLKVRRATPTQDGYKGPAFREGVDGVDASKEVLIAVNRRSSEIWVDGRMEQREQFPLMLAWALTIHKAQGLTLERVVIDAGEDERSVGLLFVAMTRVRHPRHIAFSPWPGIERVTSVIARKPALRQRKQHEQTLRGLAAQTAQRLGSRRPPPLATSAQKPVNPQVHAGRGDTPGTSNEQFGQKRAALPTPHQLQGQFSGVAKKQKAAPSGSRATGTKRKRPSTQMQTAAATRAREVAQREYEVNTAAVAARGLPALAVPARSPFSPATTLPECLAAASANGLVLEARIVDFWSGSRGPRAAVRSWLRDLGFNVTVTDDRTQLGVSCGYVAARATNLMFASADEWRSVDVSDAADQAWIDLGNETLENGEGHNSVFLETQHVYTLAQRFCEHAFPDEQDAWDIAENAWPCMQWPLTVGSLDWGARQIAETLMDFVGSTSQGSSRAFFIINTQDCRHNGSHWISVAISMRWQ